MLSVASFFLLLAVLVSPSQEHPIAGSTVSSCARDFQEKLNKTLSDHEEPCESYLLSDCCQMKAIGEVLLGIHVKSGIHEIQNPCTLPTFTAGNTQAYCDMDTDNGGWLVIQRRVEGGTVNFYRDLIDYENGFGDLEGEFWYGLKNIHCLTNNASMELRIDMQDESGNNITWTYQEFLVEHRGTNYRLNIEGGKGTPGTTDPMSHSNRRYFIAKDRDTNWYYSSYICAASYKGGWWYYSSSCTDINPNGVHDSTFSTQYRVSSRTTGSWVYYPNIEMKIRPKSCVLAEIARMQNVYCNGQ